MPTAMTVTGTSFKYSGSLETGLMIHFTSSPAMKISPEIIAVIRREIDERAPVKMGANRAPLVPDSVGETLAERHGVSPQVMSYVLPLLVEEGFCTVSEGRPVVVYRNRT